MNSVGPGDYNLPGLTGTNQADQKKGNAPSWTMKAHTRISWFPEHKTVSNYYFIYNLSVGFLS